jgi:hypothetical protein
MQNMFLCKFFLLWLERKWQIFNCLQTHEVSETSCKGSAMYKSIKLYFSVLNESVLEWQNFKLASILFSSKKKFSQRYIAKMNRLSMQIANSKCKVLKKETDYLLQQHQKLFELFCKLPKGNGAPYANSVKLRRNCMRYSINLKQFAKRAH